MRRTNFGRLRLSPVGRLGRLGARTASGGAATPLAPMDLTSMSSVTHRGVTWTFDQPQQVGFFCDGSPCVVAPAGLTITAISPASAIVDTYQAHGAMRDPAFITLQGYDGMIAVNGTSATAQALTPYDPTKNVDPAVSGPLVIAPGSRTQILKSLRKTGATTSDWQIVGSYMVLTILDTVPPKNAFRPGIMDSAKTIWGRSDDLNFNTLRNLPAVAGAPDIATVLAGNYLQPNEPVLGVPPGPEKLRRFSMEQSGPSAAPNYSGQYAVTRMDILTALHTSAPDATKLPLAILAVQYGIDVGASIKAGDRGGAGAGQYHGQAPFLALAAFMLGSFDLLNFFMLMRANMTHQQFWIQASDVGASVYFPSSSSLTNRNHQTYLPEQVGEPAWATRGQEVPAGWPYGGDPQTDNSQPGARYETVVRPNQPGEIINVGLLQNGPAGINGCQALLRNGPNDKTNRYAAAIAWLDTIAAAEPYNYGSGAFTARVRAMYDARRDQMPVPRYSGKPSMFNQGGLTSVSANDRLTAGNGSFSWNFSGVVFGSPAPTQLDIRYSTDQISWVVETNVGFTGTKTGMPSGQKLYVQPRLVSAAGAGPWGPNFSFDTTTGERFTVTPTGTPAAAAPVNILPPVIAYRDLPSWLGPHYAIATGALPTNVGELLAGDGFWSGYPYPTITDQWKLNGANIPGETAKNLLLFGSSKGGSITREVTATNASGSVTITTPAVTVPTATATQAFYIPSGDIDALPKRFTQRWAASPSITLLRESVTSRPAAQVGLNTTPANRAWSMDDLMPIGDLSNVDEADIFIRWRGTSGSGGQGPQVGFCMSGDENTAQGYVIWLEGGSSTRFRVYKVVGGVRTQVLLGTQISNTLLGISLNGYDTGARFQARKSGGQMLIRGRVWGYPDAADDTAGASEPTTWQETYTDASPLPAGRVGLVQTQNSSIFNIYGIGVGVGPTAMAPTQPI